MTTIARLFASAWRRSPVRVPLVARVRTSGAFMLVWPDVIGEAILRKRFEPDEAAFLERFLRPGMVVVDVGANIGFYTLLCARLVGAGGRVIAFEPSSRDRRRLRANVALARGGARIDVERVALGAQAGAGALYVVAGRETGMNSMKPPAVDDELVREDIAVARLDDVLAQKRVDAVAFVKIDVEGAELDVLRGSEGLLARAPRPVILVEVVDARTEPWGYAARDVCAHLVARDFSLFTIDAGGRLAPAPDKAKWHENVVAVPRERLDEVNHG